MSKPPSGRRLILVELNEVNFDVVERYLHISPGRFASLDRLLKGARIRTTSEKKYEELEPWIQWVSVHSGLPYSQHRIFRLGDIVGSDIPQLFETLEDQGLRVGSISAMNAENRLREPAYFIPDPWTPTHTDGSWWSKALSQAISQAVNDNAQSRISARSAVLLLLGVIRFAQPRHYDLYFKLILGSRGASWRKALLLDLLLHDVHMCFFRARKPQFSTVFLNAGAHIQHHYFLDADPIKSQVALRNPTWYASQDQDPVADMLEVYDRLVGEYLSSAPGTDIVVATGLSQRPYDRVKYYYRLKDHAAFLNAVGVAYKQVAPRMTRDFLIEFDSHELAASAQKTLSQIRTTPDDLPLFGEIDNRGSSLFVTLTYPNEISEQVSIRLNELLLPLKPHVAFVAIKNGMHQAEGFAFFTPGVAACAPQDRSHVKELHGSILRYFDVQARPSTTAIAATVFPTDVVAFQSPTPPPLV